MSLRSPAEDEKEALHTESSSFRHVFSRGSTRLTTGKTRLDPRLKHSGVTPLRFMSFVVPTGR